MIEERGTIAALRRKVEVRRQGMAHHDNTRPVEGDTVEAVVQDKGAQFKIQLKGMTEITTLRFSTMMMGVREITYHKVPRAKGNWISQGTRSNKDV